MEVESRGGTAAVENLTVGEGHMSLLENLFAAGVAAQKLMFGHCRGFLDSFYRSDRCTWRCEAL